MDQCLKYQDKQDTGSAQSQKIKIGHQVSPGVFVIYEDNKNKVKEDSNTIKSSLFRTAKRASNKSEKPSIQPLVTGNQQGQKRQKLTSGKKTPELEINLNSVKNLSIETPKKTGNSSKNKPNKELSMTSQEIYTSVITTISAEFAQTTFNRLRWTEPVQFSGAQLTLEKVIGLGNSPDLIHIVKIRVASSGKHTKVKQILSSMNFEEASTSAMYLDGLTNILVTWKLKDRANPLWQPDIGLHQISIPTIGTHSWMKNPKKRSYED